MITWYAVYTRPHGEAAALDNLLRQGYCAYLPRYRTRVRHARRLQSVLRPLFPRYLFAGIDRSSMPWRPILSTIGVTDVVRAGDEPHAATHAIPTRCSPAILIETRTLDQVETFRGPCSASQSLA